MGFLDFLLGQKPGDVQLDPRFAEVQQQRAQLADLYGQEATGTGVTPGEQSILDAGELARQRAGQQAMSRAAGARGFGRLAALGQAQRSAAQQEQQIAADTATRAGAQRAQDVSAARTGLMSTLSQQEQAALMEDEMRKQKAKKGFLPTALGLAGAGIGGAFGGPAGAAMGAQLGGLAGSSLTR